MFEFRTITFEEVEIISKWSYPFMPDMYMKPYFDNHKENKPLKGPLDCDGFAVYKDNALFGLFEFYNLDAEIEIGLAIAPEFVGKGYSQDYLKAGIEFLKEHYNYKRSTIKLNVEKVNLPAYKAYIKFGFTVRNITDEVEMEYKL